MLCIEAFTLTSDKYFFRLRFRGGGRLYSVLIGLAWVVPSRFRMRRAEPQEKRRRERLQGL